VLACKKQQLTARKQGLDGTKHENNCSSNVMEAYALKWCDVLELLKHNNRAALRDFQGSVRLCRESDELVRGPTLTKYIM
jgi:hypothetical protein